MKHKKLAITTIVAGAATTVFGVAYWRSLINDLQERFPEIDRKILRKAFRRIMFKSVSGQYPDIKQYSDAKMDMLLRVEVFNASRR